MSRPRYCRTPKGDDGVSLVLALVFLVLVGMFSTVALRKAETTLVLGQQVRERGDTQYALDGGVEKAFEVIRSDMDLADPNQCAQPAVPTATGQVTLNDLEVAWTCTLLAGRAKASSDTTSSDYALLVTSPHAGGLTTQSGVSSDVVVGGSMFVNGPVVNADLPKPVNLVSGDYVSPLSRSDCVADVAALMRVTVAAGYLKQCTQQTLAGAMPSVSLVAAPTVPRVGHVDMVTNSGGKGGGKGGSGGTTCRVFYPGKYVTAPQLLNGANYFVSGMYYFEGIGAWSFTGSNLTVTAGSRTVATDTPRATDDCSTVSDDDAMALPEAQLLTDLTTTNPELRFDHGVTWVFGGSARLDLQAGKVTLFTPPKGSSSHAVSVVAHDQPANGYLALTSSGGTPVLVSGMSNNTEARFNAKVVAPSARVEIYSTNNTVAVARGGLVAYEVSLKASTAGGGGLAISTPEGVGSPAPPFRTVRVVSSSSASSSTNTAVATVSNYVPYTVTTRSWRTAD